METKPQHSWPVVSDFCPSSQSVGSSGCFLANAPAKINLNLLVGPRRSDGFHPVDSFVAKISLYDQLKLTPRQDSLIRFSCQGLNCGEDSENLALRAAKALASLQDTGGVDISLDKKIPPAGGLGGGSSDAAAVLLAMKNIWDIEISVEKLSQLAADLGSDVPLFLGGPGARMTGRGEILEPVEIYPFWVVLILPEIACPTGPVYGAFDSCKTPADEQFDGAILKKPPSQWRSMLVNHLQGPAMQLAGELDELHKTISAETSLPVSMSGSGSSLFILCDDQAQAVDAANRIPQRYQSLCRIARLNQW